MLNVCSTFYLLSESEDKGSNKRVLKEKSSQVLFRIFY